MEQFSCQATTKQHSKAIFGVIKDMFSLGIKEFSKSISHIFQTPTGNKNQIPNELAQREQQLIRARKL
ncbi:MAG: hypothetical protein H6765_03270 [Candidatus Peribacteria bacterium]|nr:MAG: hypothetical protein H6765_03270 [Candidatus Peribacteria bacterium]